MKTLIIDRFEGNFAICEDKDQKFFAIEQNELPSGAAEGMVLSIDDEGALTIDEKATAARRDKMGRMQKAMWKQD